jgi:chromosome segregation ATPase
MERQERERGVARLEEQIVELLAAAEARIAALPPGSAAEYKRLQGESGALGREVERKQAELEAVNAQVSAAEEMLKRDRVRDEYAVTEKRLASLGAELAALQEELSVSQLDPAAAREKLLVRVKTDNARMQAVEKQLRAEEEGVAAKRAALAELEREVEERRSEAGDSAKYEALFKKDAEMTEFIDRFEEVREREVGAQRRTQDTILALLEHISEGLLREAALPSREAAEDMREDLADKQRELKASEMTAESLKEQLRLRQLELEKIGALEGTIGAELQSLAARMAAMAAEGPKHADIDGLRAAADAARGTLRTAIEAHAARREALRPAAAAAERELEGHRAALAAIPQAAALEAMEAQLREAEAAVFALRECALRGHRSRGALARRASLTATHPSTLTPNTQHNI